MFDLRPPASPHAVGEAATLRIAERVAHEDGIIARLVEADPAGIVIDRSASIEARTDRTSAAMDQGAPFIAGGALAAHDHRSGQPILLLRAEFEHRWRYHPVTIGAHRLLSDAPEESVRCSDLNLPLLADAAPLADHRLLGGRRVSNGLRLAHLHRLLSSAGRASNRAFGAMVGTEAALVWVDLAAAEDRRSLLDLYDTAFQSRLDAVRASATAGPPAPLRTRECSGCQWRDHCSPIIDRSRSTTIIQSINRSAHARYRSLGIDTIDQLAATDPSRISDLRLDEMSWPRDRLVGHVDEARALVMKPNSALLRRGLVRLDVPAFDREYDIDMESEVGGQAYLWGVYRASTDEATHDACWDADPELAGARVFLAIWERLNELRAAAAAAGDSIGFYCWHDRAERAALQTGALAAARRLGFREAPALVEAFLDEVPLVDLCAIAQRDLVTGRSKGLKTIAPLAGFAWRDAEPSGEASMAWHAHAVDDRRSTDEQQWWRQRLIDYNEDDVRAEAAVREWMRRETFVSADSLPPSS